MPMDYLMIPPLQARLDRTAAELEEKALQTAKEIAQVMSTHNGFVMVLSPSEKDLSSVYQPRPERIAEKNPRRFSAPGILPTQKITTDLFRKLLDFKTFNFNDFNKKAIAGKNEKSRRGRIKHVPQREILKKFYEHSNRILVARYLTALSDPELRFLSPRNCFFAAEVDAQRQTLVDLRADAISKDDLRYLEDVSNFLGRYLQDFLHPKDEDVNEYNTIMQRRLQPSSENPLQRECLQSAFEKVRHKAFADSIPPCYEMLEQIYLDNKAMGHPPVGFPLLDIFRMTYRDEFKARTDRAPAMLASSRKLLYDIHDQATDAAIAAAMEAYEKLDGARPQLLDGIGMTLAQMKLQIDFHLRTEMQHRM